MNGDSAKTPTVPGFTMSMLTLASDSNFTDTAIGIAIILAGLSQSRPAENSIVTVDIAPTPWVDEL